MTDVSVDTSRKAVAKHALLDAAGAVTEDETQATGFQYAHIASGQTFDFQVPDAVAGSAQTMLAVFGGKTLATNEASAVRQKYGDSGDQVGAIKERFDLILGGQWIDRTREGGSRIDLDVLAEAICQVMIESGKMTQEQADQGLKAKVRENLENPEKAKSSHQVPEVKVAYVKLIAMGKPGAKSVSDLASLIA